MISFDNLPKQILLFCKRHYQNWQPIYDILKELDTSTMEAIVHRNDPNVCRVIQETVDGFEHLSWGQNSYYKIDIPRMINRLERLG